MRTKMKKGLVGGGLVGLILLVLLWALLRTDESTPASEPAAPQATATNTATKPKAPSSRVASKPTKESRSASATVVADTSDTDTPEPETDEDREEKLVNAFDDLTDAWQDPAPSKVTMAEINRFRDQFNQVPKERKDECIHRALNLIPDENVMLLAGILFDKSQDKDTLETIYNDILNRDEEVKKPILKEIFKDKEHPCWADTAWILDVTQDLPTTK